MGHCDFMFEMVKVLYGDHLKCGVLLEKNDYLRADSFRLLHLDS